VDSCRSLHFTPEKEPESKIYVLPGVGAVSEGNAKICPGANQNFKPAIKISIVMLAVGKQNGMKSIF